MTHTLADALRALAQVLESSPRLNEHAHYSLCYPTVYVTDEFTPAQLAEIARIFRQAGFTTSKDFSDTKFKLGARLDLEDYRHFEFQINIDRETVCTPKVVGKEVKKVIKWDKEVMAKARSEVEEEVDIIEWDCHPLLADPSTSES